MFHVLGWSLLLVLFALWSLTAWALHAVVAWTGANAGALTDGAAAAGSIGVPEWLAPWIPAELAAVLSSSLSALGPAVDWLLGLAPALAGGLSVAIWVVWGFGSLALVLLGLFGGRVAARLRGRVPAFGATTFTP